MKKLLTAALFGAAVVASGCTAAQQQKKDSASEGKKVKIAKHFTCTMHPDVKADKPGLCPKCGMDLVEKEN